VHWKIFVTVRPLLLPTTGGARVRCLIPLARFVMAEYTIRVPRNGRGAVGVIMQGVSQA
jgi:hypothetical protein